MKANDENIISQKLDQLDTLGGGIVFGREEAWDKLQARMDRKPVRKMGLYYGMAAAVLLFIACLFFLLRSPEQQLVANTQPKQQVSTRREVAPAAAPTSNIVTEQQPTATKKFVKATQRNTITDLQEPEVIKCYGDPKAVFPQEDVVPQAVGKVVAAQPMRVVHFNELDNDMPQVKDQTPAMATAPRQMKVVTMVEVLREDAVIPEPVRSSMPLVKALFRQDQLTARSNVQTQYPLNIRINLQN